MNNQTVSLVTGGAGFVMSHVVDYLLKAGHALVVLDDLSGGFQENVHPSATFYTGSITDVKLVESIFSRHNPEFVFHGSAYAAEQLSPFIRRFNYDTNVTGSINIINACVKTGVRLMVFTSSIAVYGHEEPPFTEEMPPAPRDPYGIAKYAVEMDLRAAQEMFGLNYVIFRPHNIFGPRQNIGDPYRNVVGIFMNQCLQNRPMTIFGDGTQTRAFSYIDEVAPAIASAWENKETWNQTFNIGGAVPYQVSRLATEVARQMGVREDVVYFPPRKEALHAYCSQLKARRYFGDFMKDTPLHEGVAKMAAWVKEHGPRATKPFTNIELVKNLPPSWANFK